MIQCVSHHSHFLYINRSHSDCCYIPHMLSAYCTAVHSTTCETPVYLMMGWDPVPPFLLVEIWDCPTYVICFFQPLRFHAYFLHRPGDDEKICISFRRSLSEIHCLSQSQYEISLIAHPCVKQNVHVDCIFSVPERKSFTPNPIGREASEL